MRVMPPESSAETIRASRLCSLSISHKENSPCSSSRRISGVRRHNGSFIESMYAKRTCPTFSAFRVSAAIAVCCVACTRGTVLTVSAVRSRLR
ncbi:hypothetical protein M404DRAFT_1003446, partial [Pisolithus tinctorius Marx 270]